ncbi:MAG: hypothetical protein P8J32_07365 [bacterium]|nr:hypothetical protein [bacterium]
MSSFDKDRKWGERVERGFGDFLTTHHDVTLEYSEGKFPDWDMKSDSGVTYEVKWDAEGRAPWKKMGGIKKATGNIFVEFFNPKMNRPSGLYTSKADWLVYVMKSCDKICTEDEVGAYRCIAMVFDRVKLCEFCVGRELRAVNTSRDVKAGGEANARGWLAPITSLVQEKEESGFVYEADITHYIALPFLF